MEVIHQCRLAGPVGADQGNQAGRQAGQVQRHAVTARAIAHAMKAREGQLQWAHSDTSMPVIEAR
ncbi:hypothetical protein D9M70_387690 [compost metagenome]